MPLNFLFILNRVLLLYINFGDHNPPYPTLVSNIPSARRPGQRFNFLQSSWRSSPSLRFVNRHRGTLRRAGWVVFTKTYSRGKGLILHLPPTFSVIIIVPTSPASLFFNSLRPCPTRPLVPYLMSSSPSSHVPMSQVPTQASPCPRPLVPVPLSLSHFYTQPKFLTFKICGIPEMSIIPSKKVSVVLTPPPPSLWKFKFSFSLPFQCLDILDSPPAQNFY